LTERPFSALPLTTDDRATIIGRKIHIVTEEKVIS